MAGIKRVLVTGANGFIGSACCDVLHERGYEVFGTIRQPAAWWQKETKRGLVTLALSDICDFSGYQELLANIDAVIHLAGRAHVLRESAASLITEFRRVNLEGTEHLAELAAKWGVRRFVYVSTIKINGESTMDRPFSEMDRPGPVDPYAISKWEAEQALQRICVETGMEVVIIRPPLVYGPGVKGNFLGLLHLVMRGIPLPFSSICNSRSLVGLGNLVDLVSRCLENDVAANQTFLVSDGENLSTPELIKRIALALERPARLVRFPVKLLRCVGSFLRMKGAVDRLCSSLVVDSQKARELLEWSPPYSIDEELQRTAEWLRSGSIKR